MPFLKPGWPGFILGSAARINLKASDLVSFGSSAAETCANATNTMQIAVTPLLIDLNRGVDDPTLVMKLSDGTIVLGNLNTDTAEIARRIALIGR